LPRKHLRLPALIARGMRMQDKMLSRGFAVEAARLLKEVGKTC